MKTIFKYFIYTALLTGSLSCKKDDIPRTPDFSKFKPEATPKGTPAGSVYTQQVGPAGGQVRSADGLLTLDIPAGALSSNTTIGIQPIINNAPLGVGKGYRLTPEGTTFSKPVKISFRYNDEILDGGLPDFLWIATQKEDGTWLGDRRSTVDKNAKTVSTETSHFSDWVTGRFINFELVPDKKTIRVGESVELELTGFLSKDEWGDDLVPLAHVSSGSDDLVPVDRFAVAKEYHAFDVGDWTLNGSKVPVNNANGSLDSYYDGLHAEYRAPAKVPSPRTVAVSLLLSFNKTTGGKSSVMLVSNITIVEDGYYFRLVAGGKEYLFTGYNLTTPISEQADRTAAPAARLQGALLLSGSTKSLAQHSGGTFVFSIPATAAGSYRLEYDKHPASFFPDEYRGNSPDYLFYANEDISHERGRDGSCVLKSKTSAGLTFRITRFGDPRAAKEEDRVVEGTFMGQMGEISPLLQLNCRNTNNKINVSGDFRLLLLAQ